MDINYCVFVDLDYNREDPSVKYEDEDSEMGFWGLS